MWPKLGKEVETIFTRTEVLELKSIINEIKKNSLDELNIKLKIEEDKVSEVEDRSIGITQCEEQRDEKKKKKDWRKVNSLRDLWDNIKLSNVCVIGVPDGEISETWA